MKLIFHPSVVMEYLSGGHIEWNPELPPSLTVDQTRRIMRDVVLGLEYRKWFIIMFFFVYKISCQSNVQVHFQGIIHRDIKPANLMWDEKHSYVKIGDFGVSHAQQLVTGDGDTVDPDFTPTFIAPEVVSAERCRSRTTKAVDIWALGVTLYCLLFGKPPWTGENRFALYHNICNEDWQPFPRMGSDRLRTRVPGNRHSQGSVVMRLLDGMLTKEPDDRITLDAIKVYTYALASSKLFTNLNLLNSAVPGSSETSPTPMNGSRERHLNESSPPTETNAEPFPNLGSPVSLPS